MSKKILGTIGLIFLIISQIIMANGFDFLQAQKTIDFAHWFLLIGAVLIISFSFIFPKSIFNTIATFLTIIGIVAHIGMCTIDFILWSFGDDYAQRDQLISHLINKPVIWYPFIVIGPSFLYAGLATQAWQFIRTHTIYAILTLAGSMLIGLGYVVWQNHTISLIGYILMSIGLILLANKKIIT